MSIALQARIKELEDRMKAVEKMHVVANGELMQMLVQALDRIKALEQKRGPGRPKTNG